MNQTEILRQKRKIQTSNGVRTPRLDEAPTNLIDLYIDLGCSRHIASLTSITHTNKVVLHVVLREGEKQNLVTIAKIKAMFKKFPKTKFPANFEGEFVRIEIPVSREC